MADFRKGFRIELNVPEDRGVDSGPIEWLVSVPRWGRPKLTTLRYEVVCRGECDGSTLDAVKAASAAMVEART